MLHHLPKIVLASLALALVAAVAYSGEFDCVTSEWIKDRDGDITHYKWNNNCNETVAIAFCTPRGEKGESKRHQVLWRPHQREPAILHS